MKFSFLGERMSQTAKAIPLWELLLSKQKFARIIEIGTQSGSFSHFLYLWCDKMNASFFTFDIKDQRTPFIKKFLPFIEADVFDKVSFVGSLIEEKGQSIIFCDGGNKEKEFNTFKPYLKSGDIIAVHDFGTEAKRENLDLDGLKELLPKECDDEGFTRFFQKK